MQNPHFGSKIKIQKNMSKFILKIIFSCFLQKTAPKNTKYSRNKSFFRIRHHAKAIAHAKSSLWLKKLKFQNTSQNPFYNSFTVVLCKKPLQKNTKYSRNESIFKIGHHAKAIAHAKSSLWLKN